MPFDTSWRQLELWFVGPGGPGGPGGPPAGKPPLARPLAFTPLQLQHNLAKFLSKPTACLITHLMYLYLNLGCICCAAATIELKSQLEACEESM